MKKILIPLLLLTWVGLGTMNAQTITGVVTGEQDKEPLSGVAVMVKNSTTGTFTDNNGKYSVTVPSLDATLIFAFVGMNTIEVPVNNRTVIDVSMVTQILGLDEVFVTAYGTSKRQSFTGSASVVKSDELQKVVTTSVTGALQGTTSGIQVVNVSSQPGNSPQIRIRGISSINGSSDPLYVVNGAPFGGDLNSIDINDVESISVLKDASATALYGSRASAGVIMITTRKGVEGKPVFNIKVTQGVNDLAMPLHKRVNNAQYYEMRWEAGKNGYLDRFPAAPLAEAEAYATATLLPKLGGYNSYDRFPLLANGKIDPAAKPRWGSGPTDWEDAIIHPAPRSEVYMNMSGGTPDKNTYSLSLGYLNDQGAWSFSGFERFSARVDVTNKFNKVVEAGVNAAFTHGIFGAPNTSHCFRLITDMPDIYPVYQWDDANNTFKTGNDNGKEFDMGAGDIYSYNGYSRATWSNIHPLQQQKDDIMRQLQDNLNTRAFISITPVKGLNFRSQIAADYLNYNYKEYWSSERSWAAAQGGLTWMDSNLRYTYTFSNILSYIRSFGDHNINILGGVEFFKEQSRGLQSQGENFALPTLTEIGAASLISYGSSWEDNHSIQSYLSKLEYNYMEKYFFTGSFRRDGTSRFAPESRWGNFGSVGASWRMSKEAFLSGTSGWLKDLTLRASYGSQGNENIASWYAYLGTYNISREQGQTALQLSTVSNTALKWESDIQTNIGLSTNLFERVIINFDYFVKNSKDLLFNRQLPLSSGLASISENIGDLQNKGFEFELHTYNLPSSSQFKWETFINVSHYANKITRLPSEEIQAGNYRYKVGVSCYEYYLREWRGVNPENGMGLWSKGTEGETTEDPNEATLDYRGNALPDAFGNIMNNFYYKGLDLSLNVVYSIGGYIYDQLNRRQSHPGSRNIAETFAAKSYDYWTPTNTDATMTRLTDYGPIGNLYISASTRYLVDATYARVRNITLGYTIPKNITSKIRMTNVRVFFQADNQFTFFAKKSRGLDPEQQIGGYVEHTFIPPMKTLVGGLSVNF